MCFTALPSPINKETIMSVEKVAYASFAEWKAKAETLGWVHCHDNFIVCDDENDQCVGEFDSDANTGWLTE
jgi:hypothetical protein